ncbi:MAG: hypothetical protein IJS53_04315 [Clostridia bacterium]|nr:hypothetical protein [Clostridia bacterium]
MLKRILTAALLIALLCRTALADNLPVYHQPSGKKVPYEEVEWLDEAPFDPDAELLYVDILGIRQGDCIIITCGGQRMLVDGGENWRYPNVRAYLQLHGIEHFDYFFLTHAHDDHIEMQQRFITMGYLTDMVISPYDMSDSYSLWDDYKEQLTRAGIPFTKIQTGDVLQLGGATLTFYRRDDPAINMNNHSACAMLQFGEARMFLAADIGGDTQHWLLDTFGAEEFDCDIYKSAHHNRTATVPEFLEALSPALVINTNTREETPVGEEQQAMFHLPRYYITTGTVHLATDGTQWYAWLEPMPDP